MGFYFKKYWNSLIGNLKFRLVARNFDSYLEMLTYNIRIPTYILEFRLVTRHSGLYFLIPTCSSEFQLVTCNSDLCLEFHLITLNLDLYLTCR